MLVRTVFLADPDPVLSRFLLPDPDPKTQTRMRKRILVDFKITRNIKFVFFVKRPTI